MKPRKPLRRVSPKRTTQNQLYVKVKKAFLDNAFFCVKCNNTIQLRYRTLHHFYGRTGELLCWVPGFRMACMPCHNWIETHRNDAVRLNLRAPNNLFGRPSKVIPR